MVKKKYADGINGLFIYGKGQMKGEFWTLIESDLDKFLKVIICQKLYCLWQVYMYEGYPFIFPGSLEQNVAINDLPNLSTCSDSDEQLSSSIKDHK